jgi:hypothetical protein
MTMSTRQSSDLFNNRKGTHMTHRSLQLLVTIILLVSIVSAKGWKQKTGQQESFTGLPNASVLNINKIAAWYINNGEMENNPLTGNSGLTYPRGTAAAVYSSGLLVGAYSNDAAMAANQPRVTGTSYNSGFGPGAIIGLRTGIVESSSDPNVRIWRIRKDYATADLTQDAAEVLQKAISAVTPADIQSVRDQYRKDWQEWPAAKGAPFYDANNDGIYTPQFETVGGKEVPKVFPAADEPGTAKADQVIWYVCNDIAPGDSPWKTKPMGLEQQVTIWGYNNEGVIGNVIYKKFKLIYKGTSLTPVGGQLTDMYLTHWSDPDLGNAGDDFTGCDTLLSLGYVFNSQATDADYAKFGLVPPALGFDFLQGPIVPSAQDTAIFDLKRRPGFKNLPMTSFIYFAPGDEYSDPPFTLNGSWQWYGMMMGLPPTPQGPPFPAPLNNPTTNLPTRYWLSGDPVARTGWYDEDYNKVGGDRRFLQSSGPFTMTVGDTQEIVVGVLTATGNDHLNSVTKLKEYDRYVQFVYNKLFSVIPPSLSVSVTYPNANDANILLKAIGAAGAFTGITAGLNNVPVQLFDDGLHADGGANDGTFANTVSQARIAQPVPVDLSFTDNTNQTMSINRIVDKLTTAGPLTITGAPVLFDNINNNGVVNNGEYVHYVLKVKNGTSFGLNGVKMFIRSGAVSEKEYVFGTMASQNELTMDAKEYHTFRLPMSYSDPGFTLKATFIDAVGNTWFDQYTIPVVQFAGIADSLQNMATNKVGINDGRVGFVLYDPALTGQQYDIWYGGTADLRNWTVVKSLPSSDYAAVSATLLPSSVVPPVTTQPGASGSGTFTLNDAMNQVNYTATVSGLSGAVTGAAIKAGISVLNGPTVHSVSFTGTTATGSWQIPDSLKDDLIAGNLYLEVQTAANPAGELRGHIVNGLTVRQAVPALANPLPGIFTYTENRLVGYSLFIGPAPRGIKSVRQTAPAEGNVWNTLNPDNSYRIVSYTPDGNFAGTKSGNAQLEIRFTSAVNWAMIIPNIASPTPALIHFAKVPFAVYLDTTRVWPVIYNINASDSTWSTAGNPLVNGKPAFDRFYGVADIRDGSGNDMSYYSPLNTVFPPTSTAVKGRILNAANHVYKDIVVVNEKADGIAPVSGTNILFANYRPIQPGDIKSITLQPLGVETGRPSAVPEGYSLEQNYPNPFNPSTTIQFGIAKRGTASVEIFDVLGRKVRTVISGEFSEGIHRVQWDGRNDLNQSAASGFYLYRLSGQGFSLVKRMVLLK